MRRRTTRLRRLGQALAAVGVLALVAGGGGIATAAAPAKKRSVVKTGAALPDLDRRWEGARMMRSGAQAAALAALGNVEVGWNEIGTPHSLRAREGTLTQASSAAPDQVARAFVRDNAVLFRQQPDALADLELTMNHRLKGATFLRYKQLHEGRDVHGSSLLVVLDASKRIHLVGGLLAPSLGPVQTPAIDATAAVATVAASVSPRRLPPIVAESATTFRNTLALPKLRKAAPVKADLVTVPTATGGRTAWRVRAEVASNADYETLVDAQTGELIFRDNMWSNSEPHGLVHTGDDPEAGGQVADVLFSGIDGSWVDGDTTSGNNVNAYQDLPNDNTADPGDQPVNADQHFDFTWTDPWGGAAAMLPTAGAERDAVVTQLFYYTNWFHDYAYDLGFTETARNFQEDNFGRGGDGGDAVLAESDDGYGDGVQELCTNSDGDPILCRNNANFNTNGADGNNPRMQMYVGDTGGRRTQRAMNRDTVIHEYVHGVTGRIISNTNLQGGVQSGALGEGWSDAFATSINNDPVYGEYNNGNYTTGIRGVAYDDSDLTYGDLCNVSPSGCQVHADGTIWATAMWEERTALVGKHGFATGKAYHEQLLMLGLFATPDTPSYHDARTGYLAADALLELFGASTGDNQCLIWRVFADNELGVTAAPDGDDDTTPTLSTATPPECDPEAVIEPTVSTPEGTAVSFDGSNSVANGDDGDTLSYAWDFDGDDDFADATGPTPSWTYGDNGSFTAKLRVTNTAGYTDVASTTVTVTNVAPTVTISAAQVTSRNENQVLSVSATFSDPGWLDTYTGTVDPGTTFLASQAGTIAITTQGGPGPDLGTVSADVTYGDNGSFTVTVSVTDDDGGTGSDSFVVTVSNLNPIATIDESGAVLVNGVPTFFADEGVPIDFTARVQDEGSDDETWHWDWGDGLTSPPVKNQVAPPADDPLPSPNVDPRDFLTNASHAWAGACMYQAVFHVTDDDGGTASDSATVLITGPPSRSRGAGYWQHQYRGNGKIDFTTERLECYLEIAAFLSNVFNEERDASTIPKAYDDIFVGGNKGTMSELLDRQLLTSWLNFANGGVEYTEMLDTDGNGSLDTAFVDVMTTAENVRLNPAATRAQLEAQKNLLERINGRDGG